MDTREFKEVVIDTPKAEKTLQKEIKKITKKMESLTAKKKRNEQQLFGKALKEGKSKRSLKKGKKRLTAAETKSKKKNAAIDARLKELKVLKSDKTFELENKDSVTSFKNTIEEYEERINAAKTQKQVEEINAERKRWEGRKKGFIKKLRMVGEGLSAARTELDKDTTQLGKSYKVQKLEHLQEKLDKLNKLTFNVGEEPSASLVKRNKKIRKLEARIQRLEEKGKDENSLTVGRREQLTEYRFILGEVNQVGNGDKRTRVLSGARAVIETVGRLDALDTLVKEKTHALEAKESKHVKPRAKTQISSRVHKKVDALFGDDKPSHRAHSQSTHLAKQSMFKHAETTKPKTEPAKSKKTKSTTKDTTHHHKKR